VEFEVNRVFSVYSVSSVIAVFLVFPVIVVIDCYQDVAVVLVSYKNRCSAGNSLPVFTRLSSKPRYINPWITYLDQDNHRVIIPTIPHKFFMSPWLFPLTQVTLLSSLAVVVDFFPCPSSVVATSFPGEFTPLVPVQTYFSPENQLLSLFFLPLHLHRFFSSLFLYYHNLLHLSCSGSQLLQSPIAHFTALHSTAQQSMPTC
jgi:hypothetical protein